MKAKVRLCGAMLSLPIADARADHDRGHEAGDAGIDVNDRAAGEVERAHLEEQADRPAQTMCAIGK